MSAKFLMKSMFALMPQLSTLCGLAQMPNPHGQPINLEKAKMVAAPALDEARKNNWTVAVVIVDVAGNLVYFENMDNTRMVNVPRQARML
jgi:hypothetical protein